MNFVVFDFVNHKAIYKQLPGVYSMIKSREVEGLPEGVRGAAVNSLGVQFVEIPH